MVFECLKALGANGVFLLSCPNLWQDAMCSLVFCLRLHDCPAIFATSVHCMLAQLPCTPCGICIVRFLKKDIERVRTPDMCDPANNEGPGPTAVLTSCEGRAISPLTRKIGARINSSELSM